jgi:hypothetical protein
MVTQNPKISKAIMSQKNEAGNTAILDFKA